MSEADWTTLRNEMVDTSIATREITNPRVIEAMRTVPRHLFVPEQFRHAAYEDKPLPIGADQTISQPYMVALMTQLLEPKPSDTMLEVGTGSGYQAAVLARLIKRLYTIERVPELARAAAERLKALGCGNVTVICADGTLGYPEAAPYNGIIVTAGGPKLPDALVKQLAPGGRLVCPVGPRDMQQLCIVRRTEAGISQDADTRCMFVPLIGKEGWPE